jgi:hypothetical protein
MVHEEPVAGQGRWCAYTPLGDRSQRMHRFTAKLLNAVSDGTAGGVDGASVGWLAGRDVTCARAPGSDRSRLRDPSACTSDVST